jgi:hypothetical protein
MVAPESKDGVLRATMRKREVGWQFPDGVDGGQPRLASIWLALNRTPHSRVAPTEAHGMDHALRQGGGELLGEPVQRVFCRESDIRATGP